MKALNFGPAAIVIGENSLEYLKELGSKKALIVSGGSSMEKSGVLAKAEGFLKESGAEVAHFKGIAQDPTKEQVYEGVEAMKAFQPDTVVAIGGGSTMDASKAIVLFCENPDFTLEMVGKVPFPKTRKTRIVAVPSTSGTASEATRTSVVSDTDRQLKIPVIDQLLKPDVAILDASLPMTMPDHIVAETGIDAMAHAIECYTRHDLDDFNEVLAKGAIEGILKWLPVSVLEKTSEARERMHHYQCIAGMAFTNVGVTVVHGISHALGAMYHIPHGLGNAIILPFALEFNKQDPQTKERLEYLSKICFVDDIVSSIADLKVKFGLPLTLKEYGITEETFKSDLETIIEKSMMGATKFNPVAMNHDNMKELLEIIYYGK